MSSEFAVPPGPQGEAVAVKLRYLIEKWFSEEGNPIERPSWPELKSLLPMNDQTSVFWDDFFNSLPLDKAFLLSMAVAASETSAREAFLKRACKMATLLQPESVVATLKFFPQALVLSAFGPALLEPKPLGPLAVYILSELKISISPGDVPAILEAGHSSETLEKLAKLVPKEHYLLVKDVLNSTFSDASEDVRSRAQEFLEILKSGDELNKPTNTGWRPALNMASPLAQAQARLNNSVAISNNESGKAEPQKIYAKIYNFLSEIDRNVLIGIVALAIAIPTVFLFSGESEDSSSVPAVAPMPLVPDRPPAFWIDSVSRRRITREFLAADNNFQTGEMFLMRMEYDAAISFFQDALKMDGTHVGAQFRLACCLYFKKDYKNAVAAFNKALKMQSNLPGAHLYLARIAAEAQDWETSLKHYREEFALTGDILVALEYAELLKKLGRISEALTFLNNLPSRYAGQLEVVNMLAQLKEQTKGGRL